MPIEIKFPYYSLFLFVNINPTISSNAEMNALSISLLFVISAAKINNISETAKLCIGILLGSLYIKKNPNCHAIRIISSFGGVPQMAGHLLALDLGRFVLQRTSRL